jgi:hypothetical protein
VRIYYIYKKDCVSTEECAGFLKLNMDFNYEVFSIEGTLNIKVRRNVEHKSEFYAVKDTDH